MNTTFRAPSQLFFLFSPAPKPPTAFSFLLPWCTTLRDPSSIPVFGEAQDLQEAQRQQGLAELRREVGRIGVVKGKYGGCAWWITIWNDLLVRYGEAMGG